MEMFAFLPEEPLKKMAYRSAPSAEDFRARMSAPEDRAKAFKEAALGSGSSMPDWLMSFDLSSFSWRTSQLSLQGGLTKFSGSLPRSGMMRSGIAYQLQPLAIPTRGTVPGLLPTPRHCDGTKGSGIRKDGGGAYGIGYVIARLLGLSQQTTTMFDPSFSELLMGFPIGWTELEGSETPSSRNKSK